MHDIGWSGWFSILIVIPLVNLLLILFLFVKASKKEINKYGQVPVDKMKKRNIFFWVIFITALIFYVFLVEIEEYIPYDGSKYPTYQDG